MPLTPNTRLGPYEVLAPLGAGGMGEVYRARDTRLDRDVAIKVLPAPLTTNAEFKQRFDREAKSISQLAHPHICTLHDVGHENGIHYLVMELLEGESLGQRLAKGPLPLEAVLRFGAEIAAALDAAHRKGVVHRDLKPGNIMLTKTGAKLLDFGLAKSSSVLDSDPGAVTVTQPLTTKGTLIGTFQYMAPEQLDGMEADARTDIFALGAVLYEMATGKRAFEGASRASLIASIMTSQPRPLSDIQPMTPPGLDRLIRKCLAKDPDQRWQSAADVADELRWISESGSQLGARATNGPRRRMATRLGWAAGIVLAALAGSAWPRRTLVPAPVPTHLSISLPAGEVVDGGVENLALAISPDGRALAYCARAADGIQLYYRRFDQREAVKVQGTLGAYDPFFSPDGEWIGYFSGQKLFKVSVGVGASVPLADAMEARSATWVDQTVVYAPTFSSPLMRVAATGGKAEAVTALNAEKRERSHRWPAVLPGGEWLMYTVGTIDNPSQYDDCGIEAVSLRTGERRLLVHGARMAGFAPPGYLIFARRQVLFAAPIDPADPRMPQSPIPVLDGVAGEDNSGAAHFCVSANGTLAYVPVGAAELDDSVWVDMDGRVERTGVAPRSYEMVRVSPDGTQLLLSSGRGITGELWTYSLEGGRFARVTSDRYCTNAFWMPDQRHIVYRTEDGGYRIKVQPIDASEPARTIHFDTEPVNISDVSPDASLVVFHKYGNINSDIMVVPTDGSGPARVLWEEPGSQYAGSVSPDGRWLAYNSRETGTNEVFIRSSTGQTPKWQISVDGGSTPLWSPDGSQIYYQRGSELMSVAIKSDGAEVTSGVPSKVFDLPPGRRFERDTPSYDITPDGKRFVMLRSAGTSEGRRQINVVLNWSEELRSRIPLERKSQ